jgi:hypothetical protein
MGTPLCSLCSHPAYSLATLVQFDTVTQEFCAACLAKPLSVILMEAVKLASIGGPLPLPEGVT